MKIADVRIGNRLNVSFALATAMLAVVVILGATRLIGVSTGVDAAIKDNFSAVDDIGHAKGALEQQSRHLRDALLAADGARMAAELDAADRLGAQADAMLSRLGERLPLPGLAAFGTQRERLARLARSGQKDAAMAALPTLAAAEQAYFDALDQLAGAQASQLRERAGNATDGAVFASRELIVIGAIGAGLSTFTAWYLGLGIVAPIRHSVKVARTVASGDLSSHIEVRSRDEVGQLSAALKEMNDSLARIVGQVRSGTDTIARASQEIAAGNQDLSARTEQQASTLEETASSMAQLTGTVGHNADNAAQAKALALAAWDLAVHGGDVVGQMATTMQSIHAGSRRIAEIVGVIDSIAFQTNILALNAAVEAARAGEQGRGFAVVAGEVRNLAQRSAAAARDVKLLIDASGDEMAAGARLASDAGRSMTDIVGGIGRVSALVSEIADASSEQLAGIVHVNAALAQIDQATQQNAALVEEAAAAAASMRAQATELAAAVDWFTLSAQDARRPALAPVIALAHDCAPQELSESHKMRA
ncbi:methyl-accepting chemotaxis protein [Massilia sp. R2A-15]|uniref:methyl-accepting chemotaxis protein n=1 Tax=Massilia sp. R2A-15 TaxID=3064278 RepID=UPI00273629BF|nr:methyl-accepting chemotaxis protein [Massilia sp. R2A-15]WLI91324.1 methyl-accepting chemotaxis protein [Massilia sp. R2A-15]